MTAETSCEEVPRIVVTDAEDEAESANELENKQDAVLPSAVIGESKSNAQRKHRISHNAGIYYDPQTQDNLRQINSYRPGSTLPVFLRSRVHLELRKLGVDRINIALFGSPGCGKSALVNTIYLVMNGNYVEYSAERKQSQSCAGVTDSRLELRVTETISVLDNRGCEFLPHTWCEVAKQCGELNNCL